MSAATDGRDRMSADVAVVGGGPVGLALALALGPTGLGMDVAVVAPGRPGRPGPGAPGRAYALGAGTCRMLDALGLWQGLSRVAQPMERIVVTDGRVGGSEMSLLEFDAGGTTDGPAQLVEEPALLAALHDAAFDASRLRMLPAGVEGIRQAPGRVDLALDGGRVLSAPLAVAADGGASPLRRLAGIGTVGWTYGQSGIVATVAHDRPHRGVAIERFYPDGPFAMLPLTGRRTSLVWTQTSAEAEALLALDDDGFVERLAPLFGDDRGAIVSVGSRLGFPLRFQLARAFAGERLALAGDAAHVVHPLAGQGLNLGLRDVAALAECVADTARLGLDFGGPETLSRYERWRRFDTVQSALGFDALNRLFSNDRDTVRLARDLGLGLVDRLPPLKRFFMREGAGSTGDPPRLLKGEAV